MHLQEEHLLALNMCMPCYKHILNALKTPRIGSSSRIALTCGPCPSERETHRRPLSDPEIVRLAYCITVISNKQKGVRRYLFPILVPLQNNAGPAAPPTRAGRYAPSRRS